MKGQLQFHQVPCPSLEGNPLGDPTTRTTPVYVPAGATGPLPVLYFLHGFTGSGMQWANFSAFSPNVPERLDGLIDSGAMPPVIGVFVDGWSALGGSQWVNSTAIGRYGDVVARDVTSWVDASFATIRSAAGRAVLGKSSGGYGALALMVSHPGTFGHIGVHSGDAAFEYCYLHEFPRAQGALNKAGGVKAWFREFTERCRATKMRGDDHAIINYLCMSAAYGRGTAGLEGIRLPVEAETCRLDTAEWAHWLQADPVRFVPEKLEAFRALQSIFIDCGTRDEFNLRWGARMISQSLTSAGIDHLHEEFDDGHMGINYRFDRSMVWLSKRMVTSR